TRLRRRRPRDSQTPHRDAPPHARQRLLRTTGRNGLPLRIHLRILQLLRHHHRVPAHPATTARRRRPQGPNRSPEDLRRHPQPPRHHRIVTDTLDTITRISTTIVASTNTAATSHLSTLRPPTTLNTRDRPPADLTHQKVSGLTGAIQGVERSGLGSGAGWRRD